jgi:hypothetical protein
MTLREYLLDVLENYDSCTTQQQQAALAAAFCAVAQTPKADEDFM